MMKFLQICIALFVAFLTIGQSFGQQGTYVIVHGAWGGAWQFKNTANLLTKEGNIVYRPTLTGLGERHHLLNDKINLSTHVEDVVNMILFENLQDVILVGHSYGGMVITAVADQIPDRIKKVVYLDAIIAEDGMSVLESLRIDPQMVSSKFRLTADAIVPTWVRDTSKTPRDVPQPLATFTEKVNLKNTKRMGLPTSYIFTFEPQKGGMERDDFYRFYEVARGNNWETHVLEASHNPQIDKLEELVQLLIKEK